MSFFSNNTSPKSKISQNMASQSFFQSQPLFTTQDLNFNYSQESLLVTQHSQSVNQSQDIFSSQNYVASQKIYYSGNESSDEDFSMCSKLSENDVNSLTAFDHSPRDSIFSNSQENIEIKNRSQSDEENETFSYAMPSTSSTTSGYSGMTNNLIQNLDGDVIPKSVLSLYTEIKKAHSDWTFISVLVGQLCSDIFPMGAYHNLKLSLLMSLVSQSEKSLLHIIAMGRETCDAYLLMKSIGRFAKRFFSIQSQYNGITITKNNKTEAGPLVLASLGVAYIGDWTRFTPKVSSKFVREIETSSICVEKTQKRYPLQSTIWSHWSCSGKIKKDLVFLEQFLNVFGILILVDDENYEETLVDDLLDENSVTPSARFKSFQISTDDMQAYINYVKNQEVQFDERAEEMLKHYFLATKMIRPSSLTEKAYQVLKMMSESHAKLCLRHVVMRQDVLAAINISEKFIKSLFDTDSYSSPKETKATVIDHIDEYQSELFKWFSNFSKDILEKI